MRDVLIGAALGVTMIVLEAAANAAIDWIVGALHG